MSLLSAAVRAVPAVPRAALRLSIGAVAAGERAVLAVMADRLHALEAPASPLTLTSAPAARAGATDESAPVLLSRLLDRALSSNTEIGRADHAVAVLKRLVPDEARILTSLARDETAPIVSVFHRRTGQAVLLHASSIGRSAAVTVPSHTPSYVSHLFALGLVEVGPKIEDHQAAFEMVLAERAVRDALKAGAWGVVPARVTRGSLRISPFGREIWAVATPPSDLDD